jgi:hypothetical protein
MTVIAMPTCPPLAGINWRYQQPTEVNRSEWTNKRKVAILPAAAMWTADVPDIEILDEESFWAWNAFFADLQGRANTFRLPVVRRPQIVGVTPTVNGAAQIGYNLVTAGWGTSGVKLRRGQFVTVNDQLMRLTADVVSASGAATLHFERWLRSSPANGSALVVDIPTAIMALADDNTSFSDNTISWDEFRIDTDIKTGFTCEEAF